MGFDIAVFSCSAVMLESFGHDEGAFFINALQGPLAIGIVNSTTRPKPSACSAAVALVYSWSAMERKDRLLCLKDLKETTGPEVSSTCSFMKVGVG